MLYEIVESKIDPSVVIFKDIDYPGMDASNMYELLENAELNKNVYLGHYDGYENCIVFTSKNFRD